MARLAQEQRPEIVYPERPGRIPCAQCANPHLTCFECVARVIGFQTGFVRTEQLRRRQVTADALASRDLPHAVNLRHVKRHHAADEDWHLSGNPYFRDKDDDDDD